MPNTALDRYLATALDLLSRRHALDIIAVIEAGSVGCVDCGWIGPSATFQRPKRGGRVCPACGVDVDAQGFVDGDNLARDQAA